VPAFARRSPEGEDGSARPVPLVDAYFLPLACASM
jgi:hypothetical protein